MIRSALLVALVTSRLGATLLVTEPFDYAEGPLTGRSGGEGWGEAWTQDGESCSVMAASLAYTDGSGNALRVSGGHADTVGLATTRSFRSVGGGTVDGAWISFLYQLPSPNNLFEGVNFYLGGTPVFAVSNPSTTTGPGITLNNFAGGGAVATGAGAFGESHFVVLHLAAGGGPGGSDQVEVFVDPPLTGPVAPADAVISAPSLAFDRVRLAGQSGASLRVDELRIGESFADVAPFDSNDADGDGLTDDQEVELGLDPEVSDADLIAAIRAHPEFFDLLDDEGVQASAGGGVVLEAIEGSVELIFEIQQSDDLAAWWLYETIQRPVALLPGKQFLRVRFDPPPVP